MTIEEKMKDFERHYGDPAFAEVIPNFYLTFTEDQKKYLRWMSCRKMDGSEDEGLEEWIHRLTNYQILIGIDKQGTVTVAMSHPDNLSDAKAYAMLNYARKFIVERYDVYKEYPLENKDETV